MFCRRSRSSNVRRPRELAWSLIAIHVHLLLLLLLLSTDRYQPCPCFPDLKYERRNTENIPLIPRRIHLRLPRTWWTLRTFSWCFFRSGRKAERAELMPFSWRLQWDGLMRVVLRSRSFVKKKRLPTVPRIFPLNRRTPSRSLTHRRHQRRRLFATESLDNKIILMYWTFC